jgi:hypothetical protein
VLRLRSIHPDSVLYRRWSALMLVPMAFTALITPMEVGLVLDSSLPGIFTADRIIDMLLVLDMLVNFFLVYFSTNAGVMIYDRRRIAMHYLRTTFALDLVSSVPLDLLWAMLFSESILYLKAVRHRFTASQASSATQRVLSERTQIVSHAGSMYFAVHCARACESVWAATCSTCKA